ncbi:MAG: RNA polymerase sigma factor (TIGR02999 family) [Candidatus Krumholzibacteriia bacterium]|jgi:RNA polymerase sigma factor (TIGR02999 family)
MTEPIDITQLLQSAQNDRAASEALYGRIYDELKFVARNQLRLERPDHTLQPTALVNEAYLKLVDQTQVGWQNRNHFFAIASRAIRRILVDHARQRSSAKRGGGAEKMPIEFAHLVAAAGPSTIDLVGLDEALTRLREEDAEKCEVVEMRFFGGLNNREIAEVLDVSSRTVERHWRYAKAWLFRIMTESDENGRRQ